MVKNLPFKDLLEATKNAAMILDLFDATKNADMILDPRISL